MTILTARTDLSRDARDPPPSPGDAPGEVVLALGLPARLAAQLQHPVVLDPELAGHRAVPLRHGGYDPAEDAPQGHRQVQPGQYLPSTITVTSPVTTRLLITIRGMSQRLDSTKACTGIGLGLMIGGPKSDDFLATNENIHLILS